MFRQRSSHLKSAFGVAKPSCRLSIAFSRTLSRRLEYHCVPETLITEQSHSGVAYGRSWFVSPFFSRTRCELGLEQRCVCTLRYRKCCPEVFFHGGYTCCTRSTRKRRFFNLQQPHPCSCRTTWPPGQPQSNNKGRTVVGCEPR